MATTALGTRLAGACLSLALAGVMAGCSGDAPKPASLASVTASNNSTPSANNAEIAPTLPKLAKGSGPAAAESFSRFYMTLINHAAHTGEASALLSVSASNCRSCSAISRNIVSVYESGGHIVGGSWRVTQARLQPRQPQARPVLDLIVIQDPEQVVTGSQSRGKRYVGGRQPMRMYLRKGEESWMVTRLDLL